MIYIFGHRTDERIVWLVWVVLSLSSIEWYQIEIVTIIHKKFNQRKILRLEDEENEENRII